MTQAIDKELYGKAGVSGLNAKAPLVITEKPFPHRAADDTICHDCGELIAKGEPFIVSAIEATKGMKGTSTRYSIHAGCYDIVGRVVLVLGKQATHSFDGRPSLRDLWKTHHKDIGAADPELAHMLEAAFGKVKK